MPLRSGTCTQQQQQQQQHHHQAARPPCHRSSEDQAEQTLCRATSPAPRVGSCSLLLGTALQAHLSPPEPKLQRLRPGKAPLQTLTVARHGEVLPEAIHPATSENNPTKLPQTTHSVP